MSRAELSFSLKEGLLWVLGLRNRYSVRGQSMEPLLAERDQVLVKPLTGAVREGEVIVATHPFVPQKIIIKQVTQTEKDSFFVEGMNRKCSTDSRTFGWIPADTVLGVVTAIV